MTPYRKLDRERIEPQASARLTGISFGRNPVISRSEQMLEGEKVSREGLSSKAMKLLQLGITNADSENSRFMAWDSQRIFGPARQGNGLADNLDFGVE